MGCSSSPQTTSAPPPVELYGTVCYISIELDNTWYLSEVIKSWNHIDKIKLIPGTVEKCDTLITITEESFSTNYFGETKRYLGKSIVSLNEETPSIWRRHSLCSEIGHSLGVSSSNRQTCMNPQSEYEDPDEADLREASQKLAYLIG